MSSSKLCRQIQTDALIEELPTLQESHLNARELLIRVNKRLPVNRKILNTRKLGRLISCLNNRHQDKKIDITKQSVRFQDTIIYNTYYSSKPLEEEI